MVSTEVKLWFLSSLEHFWPDPKGALSEVALFFEKMHKVFKNKAQRCSTPLMLLIGEIQIHLQNLIFLDKSNKCHYLTAYQAIKGAYNSNMATKKF